MDHHSESAVESVPAPPPGHHRGVSRDRLPGQRDQASQAGVGQGGEIRKAASIWLYGPAPTARPGLLRRAACRASAQGVPASARVIDEDLAGIVFPARAAEGLFGPGDLATPRALGAGRLQASAVWRYPGVTGTKCAVNARPAVYLLHAEQDWPRPGRLIVR
jgi:hypothetical protein